jgi:hypothetical protein
LYLIYMSTGACDIARGYIDKYIVIWNAVVMTVLKLYYFMTGYASFPMYSFWYWNTKCGMLLFALVFEFHYPEIPVSCAFYVHNFFLFSCCTVKHP